MPVSSGCLLMTMVDPTMFITIVVEGKPVDCISFKTEYCFLRPKEKELGYKAPSFT